MIRRIAAGIAWTAVFFCALWACVAIGYVLEGGFGWLLGWSSNRGTIGRILWFCGASLFAGGFALHRWSGRTAQLVCAWAVAEILLTDTVGYETGWNHSLFLDWWAGLSIPFTIPWLSALALSALWNRRSRNASRMQGNLFRP